MATIACSKSAAPIARSAASSAASSWTACVTSGAISFTIVSLWSTREHLVAERHQLSGSRRAEATETDDEDGGVHASSLVSGG